MYVKHYIWTAGERLKLTQLTVSSCEKKAWKKKSDLNRIQIQNLDVYMN